MEDVQAVQEAIRAALEGFDPEGGKVLSILLSATLSESAKDIFQRFSSKIMQTMTSCTADRDTVRVALARERALIRFHRLQQSILPNLWKELFSGLLMPLPSPLLLQSVNRHLLNHTLLSVFSVAGPANGQRASITMMSDEENAIRYASGYVAMKLLKHYKTGKGAKARQYVDCLSNMAVVGDDQSYYAYTKEWTSKANRGGLFEVNDTCFLFFRSVELQTQLCLPQLLSQQSTKDAIMKSIKEDNDVQFHWCMLSVDIDVEYTQKLLHELINKWVHMRGFAMASSWLEEYKLVSGKTVKKSKPLRKRLAANDAQTTDNPTKKSRQTTQKEGQSSSKKKSSPKKKKT